MKSKTVWIPQLSIYHGEPMLTIVRTLQPMTDCLRSTPIVSRNLARSVAHSAAAGFSLAMLTGMETPTVL